VAYFLIIVMASSTASVIGVDEIVSRSNTVISATGRNDLLVWIYLYTMGWFLLFCWSLTLLVSRVRAAVRARNAGRRDAKLNGHGISAS
jgi:polar amino acid transport system permease protein